MNTAIKIEEREGLYITTYNGVKFWPLDPRVNEIDIEDIAHSLSMLCRFNGHIKSFYSVAQHSVLVSEVCSEENKLYGLLHDASEAYLSDLPSPIKHSMPFFKKVENNLQKFVCEKFGLPNEEPEEVKKADIIVRVTEMRDLRKDGIITYNKDYKPLVKKITPWTQEMSKRAFLEAFELLKK